MQKKYRLKFLDTEEIIKIIFITLSIIENEIFHKLLDLRIFYKFFHSKNILLHEVIIVYMHIHFLMLDAVQNRLTHCLHNTFFELFTIFTDKMIKLVV